MRRFLDLAPVLFCTASHDGYFRFLSEGWTELLGWTEGELRSRPFLEFVHPDDREATTAAAGRLAHGATVVSFVNRYQKKDGGYLWLLWDAGANADGIYAIARDHTAEREAARALGERNQLLDQIEELAGIGHWYLDLQSEELYWSPRVFAIHGLDPKTHTPKLDVAIDHYHPEDRAQVRAYVQRAMELRVPYDFELRLVRADGAIRTVCSRGCPEVDPDTNEVTALFGLFQDVTAERGMERRLRESERLDSLSTLASGLAHEINNPLTYVKGNVMLAVEALQDLDGTGSSGVAELRELLAETLAGVEQVSRIVRDLKSFMRPAEADAQPLPLDLNAVLNAALNMTRAELRSRAQVAESLGSIPPVLGYKTELIQVFVNLISNAGHAVSGLPIEEARVRVSTYTNDEGWAVVEFEDNGGGIAPEHRAKIFEPFFTTKPVDEGTGLGLHIARGIVAAQGGRLELLDDPSATVFQVSLPPAPTATADEDATEGVGRRRVLVVDDDRRVAKTIERILQRDFRVVVESDPGQALRRLRRGDEFDLLVTDVSMPSMSGWDLLGLVAAEDASLVERSLVITGARAERDRPERLAHVPVVEKPFGPDDLRDAVRSLIGSAP